MLYDRCRIIYEIYKSNRHRLWWNINWILKLKFLRLLMQFYIRILKYFIYIWKYRIQIQFNPWNIRYLMGKINIKFCWIKCELISNFHRNRIFKVLISTFCINNWRIFNVKIMGLLNFQFFNLKWKNEKLNELHSISCNKNRINEK